MEIVSLASIIPFLTYLLNPNDIYKFKNKLIFHELLSFINSENIILASSILLFFVIIISTLIRLISLKYSNLLASKIGIDLSVSSFRNNLNDDYEIHIARNSSEMISTNTFRIEQTVAGLNSILGIITSSTVAIFIFISLIYINFKISIITLIIFSFSYYFLAIKTKKRLTLNSGIISQSNENSVKIVQEGFGSIKDIIINNSHEFYINKFKNIDSRLRYKQAENAFLSTYPKYPLESISIITIVFIALIYSTNNKINYEIITTLSVFALGGQKLLPLIQSIYFNWSSARSRIEDIKIVLRSIKYKKNREYSSIQNKSKEPKIFNKKIELRNVFFKYKENRENTLEKINLTINKGEKIGIIGETGCGKSTLLDILMGLLEPSSGELLIDNKLINKKNKLLLNSWHQSIAHVPQNIYLQDISFKENIAFGSTLENINQSSIINAAKIANIHNLIKSTENGYDTKIGERGTKFSGGQVQRIAIARALYKKSNILFLDEATSALDKITEKQILKRIMNLDNELTIIIITHRFSTISDCDRIYKVENREIKAVKNFNPDLFNE